MGNKETKCCKETVEYLDANTRRRITALLAPAKLQARNTGFATPRLVANASTPMLAHATWLMMMLMMILLMFRCLHY